MTRQETSFASRGRRDRKSCRDMISLYKLEDGDEEAICSRSDGLPSRMRRDVDDVQKLVTYHSLMSSLNVQPCLKRDVEMTLPQEKGT